MDKTKNSIIEKYVKQNYTRTFGTNRFDSQK